MTNIRELSRELRLSMLIIDAFIPSDFQDQIEKRSTWNEDFGEWQIPGIAYTGNSLQQTAPLGAGSPVGLRLTMFVDKHEWGSSKKLIVCLLPRSLCCS